MAGNRYSIWLKQLLLISFLSVVVVQSFLFALIVRFDGNISTFYWNFLGSNMVFLMAIKVAVLWRTGISQGGWRYVSLPDLLAILKANLAASLVFATFVHLARPFADIPVAVYFLDGIFCFLLISAVRVLTRMLRESVLFSPQKRGSRAERVLIVGSGAIGQTIAREIRQSPKLKMRVMGFIDPDSERIGQRFQGIAVLGRPSELEAVLQKIPVDLVVIAQAAIGPRELRALVDYCHAARVQTKILPAMGELIDGGVAIQRIRNVELVDLLHRKPVRLDIQEIRNYLKGKRILVTGAGGSIGSEICRQVIQFSPQRLVLFDNAETPLFHIENELKGQSGGVEVVPVLGDVRDQTRVNHLFSHFAPEVVFHAAAYKHVPMSECNPVEAVKNNVQGTRNLADAAANFGVKRFVMVSTDKAVNPTNAMGASKRAAELYIQGLAHRSQTAFVTVRFGNVLGSNGSVVPIFEAQIRKGGPVTVTHPEVTRFFMTIPEAVQLVLQAGSMGQGGEIFLLDMGRPIRIADMAEEMIRLSGLVPHEDIDIVFTGLRPGEKLYEELLLAGEGILPTRHEKIRVARAELCDAAILDQSLGRLDTAIANMDRHRVLEILKEIVPEYRCQAPPGETPRPPTPVTSVTPCLDGGGAKLSIVKA